MESDKLCSRFSFPTLLLAVLSCCTLLTTNATRADDEDGKVIKVGLLQSLTGTMALSEKTLKDAELLAIEEINKAGGVLGKQVKAIVEDAESKFTTSYPDRTKKLLLADKVAAIFGCWTSVSRKNVLPILEENNGLLFYPVPFEGNEASKNIVYSGALPNQQILPAVEWLMSQQGGAKKRFYLVGTDYVYPRTVNLIITRHLELLGLEPVEQRYTPFGYRDYAAIVQDVQRKNPDVIFSTIIGDSNIDFYDQLAAQGITADKIPVVAVNIGEDELRDLDPSKVKDHLSARCYFQNIATPKNKEFVKRFQDKYGKDRVIDECVAAAYAQVFLWKDAVEQARSTDVSKVQDALIKHGPVIFDAPEGQIKIDPKTLHAFKRFFMGKIRADRQFDIIHQTGLIAPDPWPQFVFPGWSVDWTGQGLIRGADVRLVR